MHADHTHTSAAAHIDPVCGMTVDPATAAAGKSRWLVRGNGQVAGSCHFEILRSRSTFS